MDLKTFFGNVNAAAKGLRAFSEGDGKILNPDVILNVFFSRYFLTVSAYKDSLDRFVCKNRDDFPSLDKRKSFWITSGNHRIRGYLYSVKKPKALVLCVHGLLSIADDYNAIYQDYFVRHGYDVMAIDLSNSGLSDLSSISGLEQSAKDVKAAEDYIHSSRSLSKLPLCLIGHSWGGFGVAASLNYDQSPAAVVAMAGFADPLSVMTSMPRNYVGPIADLGLEDLKASMRKRGGKEAFLSAVDGINKAKNVPVMIVHGSEDKTVLPTASIYARKDEISNPRCEFLLLNQRGHGDIWLNDESRAKRREVLASKKAFQKKYGSNIRKLSPEVLKEFTSGFTKEETSMIDEELFNEIDSFFQAAIQK